MVLATQLVHWPGHDTLMCDKHAAQAQRIGRAMGLAVSASFWFGEDLPCMNCENEAKKFAERGTGEPRSEA